MGDAVVMSLVARASEARVRSTQLVMLVAVVQIRAVRVLVLHGIVMVRVGV